MDLQSENLCTLSDATKRVPPANGKRLNPATIWRWCRIGIKSRSGGRIRLQHIRIGGRIYIDPEALGKFFRDVAEADAAHFDRPTDPAAAKPPTDRQRARSIERSEQVLRTGGIL